jgi:hypothetical protein
MACSSKLALKFRNNGRKRIYLGHCSVPQINRFLPFCDF